MARHPVVGPVAVVFTAFGLCLGNAEATVLRVPEEYATIQAAIDASAVGDSVLVGPGVWDQSEIRSLQVCFIFQMKASVAFLKPGVSLIATAGPELTVLDGGPQGPAAVETVELASVDGPPTRIEGFTITGGGDGLEIGCTDSPVEIVNCRIIDNGMIGLTMAYAKVSLIDCLVARNRGPSALEGGALVAIGSDFEAIRTRFEANTRAAIEGNGPDRLFVDECEFVGHVTRGALQAGGCNALSVRNSVFLHNRTTISGLSGAAIRLGDCVGVIEFNTFAYDSAVAANGGAISIAANSWITVRNNTFYRCYTLGVGSAVLTSLSTTIVDENVVFGCVGAALARDESNVLTPDTGCNVLWDNTADYFQWPAGAMVTDIHADPEFCDPEQLDFTVKDSSPAAPANSGDCGQIGAHGVGCGSVSVEPSSWGRLKGSFRTEQGGE